MNVFLAHATEDHDIAERIQLALCSAKYNVFFDEQSLPSGGDFHARIRAAIDQSDIFIFLITAHSISKGKFTLTELLFARKRWPSPVDRVIPVNLGDVPLTNIPNYLRESTILSVTGNAPSEVRAAVESLWLQLSTSTSPTRIPSLLDQLVTKVKRSHAIVVLLGGITIAALSLLLREGLIEYAPSAENAAGSQKRIPVPHGSISWNNSSKGQFKSPPRDSDPIVITAFPYSFPSGSSGDRGAFPRLYFGMFGDFESAVNVKIERGSAGPHYGLRYAGIGLMSRETNQMVLLGPAIWGTFMEGYSGGEDVRATFYKVDPSTAKGGSDLLIARTDACNGAAVELKIVKRPRSLTFFCRAAGKDWKDIRPDNRVDLIFGTDAIELFLFGYSTDDGHITGNFTAFSYTPL